VSPAIAVIFFSSEAAAVLPISMISPTAKFTPVPAVTVMVVAPDTVAAASAVLVRVEPGCVESVDMKKLRVPW